MKHKQHVCECNTTGSPEAFITTYKSRLAISELNKVYLKDGDCFEIELYNPLSSRVLARIQVNGKTISNSGLIINPGQRIFLERFLDTNNRFVFSTYDITVSAETEAATRNNGNIQVEFYLEYVPAAITYYPYTGNSTTTIKQPVIYDDNCNYTGGRVYQNAFNTVSCGDNHTLDGMCFTANINTTGTIVQNSVAPEREVGIIDKGAATNQNLVSGYGEFSTYANNIVTYKILPISARPLTSDDLRVYCTGCGRKLKSSWKYCPTCGETIN